VNIKGISHEEQQTALREVAILRKLRHPNIIAYKDSFVEAGNLAIIMEFAQVSITRPLNHCNTVISVDTTLNWSFSPADNACV